jgi:hypothetical protein
MAFLALLEFLESLAPKVNVDTMDLLDPSELPEPQELKEEEENPVLLDPSVLLDHVVPLVNAVYPEKMGAMV